MKGKVGKEKKRERRREKEKKRKIEKDFGKLAHVT